MTTAGRLKSRQPTAPHWLAAVLAALGLHLALAWLPQPAPQGGLPQTGAGGLRVNLASRPATEDVASPLPERAAPPAPPKPEPEPQPAEPARKPAPPKPQPAIRAPTAKRPAPRAEPDRSYGVPSG